MLLNTSCTLCAGVRGGAQPDHLRSKLHGAGVPVAGQVVKSSADHRRSKRFLMLQCNKRFAMTKTPLPPCGVARCVALSDDGLIANAASARVGRNILGAFEKRLRRRWQSSWCGHFYLERHARSSGPPRRAAPTCLRKRGIVMCREEMPANCNACYTAVRRRACAVEAKKPCYVMGF